LAQTSWQHRLQAAHQPPRTQSEQPVEAPQLGKLIEAHFPPADQRDNELNPAFIEALEQIFAENGAPWSDKPLWPIAPAGAEAPAPR
jgi:hypothetical protein